VWANKDRRVDIPEDTDINSSLINLDPMRGMVVTPGATPAKRVVTVRLRHRVTARRLLALILTPRESRPLPEGIC
jgi:hypothetical protein